MRSPHRPSSVVAATLLLLLTQRAGVARADEASIEAERAACSRDALSSPDALSALGGFACAMPLFRHVSEPAPEQLFVEQVATAARSGIARAHAGFVLARRLARAGDVDAAERQYRSLGLLPEVRALGPFTNTGGAAFGQPLPVSIPAALAASQQDGLPGLPPDVRWQTVALSPSGEFEVESRFVAVRDTRVLLAAVVRSREQLPAALRLGSSGQIRAVLNGVEVVRQETDRPARLDQTVAGIILARGENLLVVEAGFLTEEARVLVRLTDPEGAPLRGVTFAVDGTSFERAARARAVPAVAPLVVDPVALAHRTMAQAQAGDASAVVASVRAAVALEGRLRTGDRRQRPGLREAWLYAALRRLAGDTPLPAEAALDARVRGRADLLASVGDELRERGDVTGARRSLDEALRGDPACGQALLGLAALRAQQGDVEAARELFAAARRVLPTSDIAARESLDFERRQGPGGIDTAIAVLHRAAAAPTEENLDLAADVMEEQGDLGAALDVLARGNDALRKLRIRGRLLVARGVDTPVDDRLAVAREVLRLRPSSHADARTLAFLLVEARRPQDALAFAQARQQQYPQRPEPLQLAAELALLSGDRRAAIGALQSALAMVPQNAELQRTLRALAGDEDELVTRYGVRPSYERTAPPPRAVALGAHVEASTVAVRFFDNGLGRLMTDKVYVIHDARKAAGLQTFSFAYSPGREQLDVLVAERILADGRREPALRVVEQAAEGKENGAYSDASVKTVVFGQIVDGDIIHVRTRKQLVGEQNLFGEFFGMIELLQTTIPSRNQRIVIEAPLTRPLSWGGRGAPAPHVLEEEDRRIYDFFVAEAPAIDLEPGMPPFLEAAQMLSVSTYATWEEMGRWYEALVAPQLLLNDELRSVVRELVRGANDTSDIVRRIYEYVVSSTRYVGIELGIHGWKPYPVTEVHRRKYGDCKDKASLLVAMLREAGIAANLALVRTANAGLIAAQPPSMWMFNHAIAYVPGLDLFLDGTAEQSGWRELPVMDQGALTLIVGAHGEVTHSELRTIPVMPSDTNLNVSDYVLTLGRDGALIVRGQERFRGAHNAEQRREFADPARWRERLQRQLSMVMPGARVARIDVDDLSLAAAETGYRFEATLPERAVREGADAWVMALSLYPHDLSGNYAEQSTRLSPIFVERPWRTRNVMRYVLPPGTRVAELPPGGVVESEHLTFRQIVTRTADGFIVDEDTTMHSRRIPPEAYASFRAAALRADAFMKRKIRLVTDPHQRAQPHPQQHPQQTTGRKP